MDSLNVRDNLISERKKNSLNDLPDGYYGKVAEKLDELEEELRSYDDPFSKQAERTKREKDTLEDAWEELRSLRSTKIVDIARNGLDKPDEIQGPENKLYKNVRREVDEYMQSWRPPKHEKLPEANEEEVEDEDGGAEQDTDRDETTPTGYEDPPEDREPATGGVDEKTPQKGAEALLSESSEEATADGGENTSEDAQNGSERGSDTTEDFDKVTIRMLEDVEEFVGVDGQEYDLSEEDVVHLPQQNATALSNNDVAKPVSNGGSKPTPQASD